METEKSEHLVIDNQFRLPARRDGIIRMMMPELVRARKLNDIEQVNLTVVNSNEHAKTLYESFGFITLPQSSGL